MNEVTTRRLTDDPAGHAEAGALLRAGRLVAFPTETVYGLGADATQGQAAMISDLAVAGLSSVAMRVPSSTTARAIITASGRPIAAPSANRSGHVSPTVAGHVLDDLDGRIDAVVMGEAATVGVESTILSLLDDRPVILRPGGVTRADLAAVIGYEPEDLVASVNEETAPLAPGRLASHYAPDAKLRLDADQIQPGEAALLFGTFRPAGLETARACINLSPRGDLKEAAAALFTSLRALDRSGASVIAVAPIPNFGLGEAVRDRLARAAAPRP